jgi:hypothetical protein
MLLSVRKYSGIDLEAECTTITNPRYLRRHLYEIELSSEG